MPLSPGAAGPGNDRSADTPAPVLIVPGAPMDFHVMASTPPPRDGSPPNLTGKIPAAAALTGEPSGHVFLNLTPM
jgi:hypothetical protein